MITLENQKKLVEKLRESLKTEEAKLQLMLNQSSLKRGGTVFLNQTPIEILHLPERAYNALIGANIGSVEKLQITPVSELKWIPRLGHKGISVIIQQCLKKGIILNLTS